jgi:hypothetical protein
MTDLMMDLKALLEKARTLIFCVRRSASPPST